MPRLALTLSAPVFGIMVLGGCASTPGGSAAQPAPPPPPPFSSDLRACFLADHPSGHVPSNMDSYLGSSGTGGFASMVRIGSLSETRGCDFVVRVSFESGIWGVELKGDVVSAYTRQAYYPWLTYGAFSLQRYSNLLNNLQRNFAAGSEYDRRIREEREDSADPSARKRRVAAERFARDKDRIERAERDGDAAASQGRAQRALVLYAEAFAACPDEHPSKERLATKLFDVARLMSPAPEVPAEAQRHADRAESFLKYAVDAAGFAKAAREFELAGEAAPWWTDAWFNLGLAREKAGDLAGAARALKRFLASGPPKDMRAQVERRLVDLEVRGELTGGAEGR